MSTNTEFYLSKKSTPKVHDPADRSDEVVARYHHKDWHWAYTVSLVGVLVGLATLVYVGHHTMVSLTFLARLVTGCLLVGLLIPFKLYNRWFELNRLEFVILNLMGVGPILCALLLWANFLFHSDVEVQTYNIIEAQLEEEDFPAQIHVVFKLEDGALEDFIEYRRYEVLPDNQEIVSATQFRIKTATGLFGYPVMLNKQVIP